MNAPALRIHHVPGVFPDKWFARWRERYDTELATAAYTGDQDPKAMLAEADAVLCRTAELPVSARGNWFPAGPGIAIEPPGAQYHFIPLYTEAAAVIFHKEDKLTGWAPTEAVPISRLAERDLLDWEDYPARVGGAEMGVQVVATGAVAAVVPFSLVRGHTHQDVRARTLAIDDDGVELEEQPVLWRTGLLWRRDEDEHPLLQDFIGILRGRSATSARQPSVRSAEQQDKQAREQQRQQPGKQLQGKQQHRSAKASGQKRRPKGWATRGRRR